MANSKGRNRSSGRAQPRATPPGDGAEATPAGGGPAGRIARPSAKEAAAKAVAESHNQPAAKPAAKPASTSPNPAGRPPAAAKGKPAPTRRTAPPQSGRYTPPIPRSEKVSPIWVPIVMFACLGLGMVIIISNYVNLLPGPDPSNVYLVAGLVLITVGFITATRFH